MGDFLVVVCGVRKFMVIVCRFMCSEFLSVSDFCIVWVFFLDCGK